MSSLCGRSWASRLIGSSTLRQYPEHAALLERLRQADQLVEQTLAAPAQLPAGTFADYDLLEEAGRGGMGVVFKARHKSLDRIVALKVLRSDGTGEERKRFDREAQAVARLQHPNIVQVYEVGETAGGAFVSLEFVDGQSLAHRLHGTPLPARHAAALVKVLAGAMHYAHERGVIHRDLKPANVLLAGTPETPIEDCIAKVADFGLAKKLDTQGDTHSGAVLGTPSYMAPEQAEARSAAVDRRTDVYGLGAILYELLDRPAPVPGGHSAPDPPAGRGRRAGPAAPAQPVRAARPRNGLPEVPGKRSRRAATRPPWRWRMTWSVSRMVEPVLARPIGSLARGWRWCRRNPCAGGPLGGPGPGGARRSFGHPLPVASGRCGPPRGRRRRGPGPSGLERADSIQPGHAVDVDYSLGSPASNRLLKAAEHCSNCSRRIPPTRRVRIALTNVYGRLGRLYTQRGSWAKAHRFFRTLPIMAVTA